MTAIRVLLVDDHVIVREGLRQVLLSDGEFEIVGEAADGTEAMEIAERERPDVVLLDITMPGESGLVVAQRLRQRVPESRVLILSVHDDTEYVLESVRSGAHGYLRKDTTPSDLRNAVRAVHNGDAYFSPAVARRIAEVLRNEGEGKAQAKPPAPPKALLESLTNREREVLSFVSLGLLNKEIAVRLGISVRTVEAHRDSLMRKLNIRTAAGLTRFAMESGLVRSPEGSG